MTLFQLHFQHKHQRWVPIPPWLSGCATSTKLRKSPAVMIPALPSCSPECHDSVSFWSSTGYSSRLYLTLTPDPWADKIWIKGQGGAAGAVSLAGAWHSTGVGQTHGHPTAPGRTNTTLTPPALIPALKCSHRDDGEHQDVPLSSIF